MADETFDDPADKPQGPVVLIPLARAPREGFNLRHLMILVGVCAVAAWVVTVAGAWVLPFGVLLLVVAAVGAAVIFSKRKSSQQESLLLSLAIASERGAPLSPAALAFTEEYGYFFRGRVQQLALLLDGGVPLPQALESVPGLLTRDAVVLVQAGWGAGNLAQALRQASASRSARQRAWGPAAGRLGYLLAVLFQMQVIVSFVMYFVVPKMEAIFMDFGLPLPAMTTLAIRASHALTDYAVIPITGLLIELGLLIVLPVGLFNLFQLDLAPLDFVFRRRHTGLLLRALALTVGGGKPIEFGIAELARSYPSAWLRSRLLRANAEVRLGGDWLGALRTAGLLPAADAAALAAAVRVGNLGWVLNELADARERRLGYRLQFWLQFLFPLAVIGIGSLVLFFVVAYFVPLISLIERLAG